MQCLPKSPWSLDSMYLEGTNSLVPRLSSCVCVEGRGQLEVELTYIEQSHLVSDVLVGRRGEDIRIELLGHCQHIVEGSQVGKVP